MERNSPYREPRSLNAIIPPDRRKLQAFLLVLTSMLVGAAMLQVSRWALERTEVEPPPVVLSQTSQARLAPVTLTGPDGAMRVPAGAGKTIVNVWLQGCQDCMPAFEAVRDKGMSRCTGATVVNVAYGEADPTWAGRYGVRTNLVFDHGGENIVRPLGITSFTTLVLDHNGIILHRDRPDRVGFEERMSTFCGSFAAPPDTRSPHENAGLDQAAVERVVRAHRATVKRACWDRPLDPQSDGLTSADVTVNVVVGPTGSVVETSTKGNDKLVAHCVEMQVRTWLFPAPGERSKVVTIPFKFVRQ